MSNRVPTSEGRPEPYYVLNHAVHDSWGDSRLVFWVVRFRTLPDVATTHDVVARTLETHGVVSFATYELLGLDYMVRAWVPRSTSCELLDDALRDSLQALGTEVDTEYLEVHEIVRHWVFSPAGPGQPQAANADVLTSMPERDYLSRLNATLMSRDPSDERLTPDELSRALDSHIIGPYLDIESIFGGIKFVMLVKCFRANKDQKREVKALIDKRLEELGQAIDADGRPVVNELSFYFTPGAESADFVIMGRLLAESFYDGLRVLLDFVLEPYLRHVLKARPQTYVLADHNFTRYRDGLVLPPKPENHVVGVEDIEVLLSTVENSYLEFKATAYADFTRWLYKDGPFEKNDGLFFEGIVRTIAAFLNSPPTGGQLVIGALELTPVLRQMPSGSAGERIHEKLSRFERRGDYALVGLAPDIEAFQHFSAPKASRITNSDSLSLHIMDRLQSLLKTDLVVGRVDARVVRVGQAELLVLSVRPSGPRKWAYFEDEEGHERFVVRSGGRTRTLSNSEGDEYKSQWVVE